MTAVPSEGVLLSVHFVAARDGSGGGTGLPTRGPQSTGRETRATSVAALPRREIRRLTGRFARVAQIAVFL